MLASDLYVGVEAMTDIFPPSNFCTVSNKYLEMIFYANVARTFKVGLSHTQPSKFVHIFHLDTLIQLYIF